MLCRVLCVPLVLDVPDSAMSVKPEEELKKEWGKVVKFNLFIRFCASHATVFFLATTYVTF